MDELGAGMKSTVGLRLRAKWCTGGGNQGLHVASQFRSQGLYGWEERHTPTICAGVLHTCPNDIEDIESD